MKITDVKINGIKNPIGYRFDHISVSWKVTETNSLRAVNTVISVAADEAMKEMVIVKEGDNLNSLGEVLDFELMPRTRYFLNISINGDKGDSCKSEIYFFETGKMDEKWTGKWIEMQEGDSFHPRFYKAILCEKPVKKARLYVTGLGLYEACLNGEKISEELLTPYFNDYNEGIQYQTYDVTDMISGDNILSVETGNGWYKGRIGYEGGREFYGNRFRIIAELHIEYEDGCTEVIATDGSWQYLGSDTEFSDNYDGEIINRLLWDEKEKPPKAVVCLDTNDDGSAKVSSEKGAPPSFVTIIKPIERYSPPVLKKETITVKNVMITPSGETVLDMGQNFTGYISFSSKGLKRGDKVFWQVGEVLQQGEFYRDNYRTAKAEFTYIADGTDEIVYPHFSFFGFRYVRITGIKDIAEANILGHAIYSDLDETVSFESDNSLLNQLFSNCMWGQKSNFVDMPTDCPQRDERLGWTGDAQVFSPTACINMYAKTFLNKFLRDLRFDQEQHEGCIAGYIPNFGAPMGSSVWGDAATFIPTVLYETYGDVQDLKDNYPLMKDWVRWIISQDKAHGEKFLWNFGFHFGDWLAQDGVTSQSMKGGTEDHYIASMYYFASLNKVADTAKILGMNEDYCEFSERAEKVKKAILDEYFTPNGRLCIETQTGYLLSLRFKVYRNLEVIKRGLKNRLEKDCYKIKGGFVGATTMCQTLAENGFEKEAYYILFQEGFPGWMHCIKLGATTIWERWNSILDDGSISGTGMNSLNHYAYGSVMEYVYKYIAGIKAVLPGYREVIFAPQLSNKLRYVKYSYESACGKYVSNWSINDDGTVTVHFEVPFGCRATAYLPGTDEVMKLNAGSFDKTYKPKTDYRRRYSDCSLLYEVQGDDEAIAILKEDLPEVYSMVCGNDDELLSQTFEQLKMMFFFGLNPQKVEKGTKRLFEL